MIKRVVFTALIALLASAFMVQANAQSRTFQVGQTVFVGFPAPNIKDDAFIIGLVRKVLSNNRYQIKVMDYVQGHDYGVSCVPMAIDEQGNESEAKGWELWDDKKKLTQNGVEYIVSGKNVMPLSVGQHKFITRNNVFTTYSRWRSNAPMLSVDRLNIAESEARSVGLGAMVSVFELAKLDRQAYYEGNFGRPYWPYEAVDHLPVVLKAVIHVLKTHPKLNKLWRQTPRDWKAINQDTYTYFMVDAIDKIVSDASGTLDEDMEKADPQAIKEVKRLLKRLGVQK